MNRILHWEANVTDLDATVDFYEALSTFRAGEVVTDPSGAFRSCLLENSNAAAPVPTLHLVQWIDPRPTGVPYDTQAAVGFFRVVMHVTDLDETFRAAVARGIRPFAPITGDDFIFHLGSSGPAAYRVFAVHDPDGIVVEFIENASPKLSVVAQGTGALESNLAFYTDVLGLDLTDTVETPGPVPNVYLPAGEPVEFSGAFFRVRGDERGYLDWLQHAQADARGTPYDVPHHVGVIRCALEVDDLDAAERALRAARWNGRPVQVEPRARDVTFGGWLGVRRVLGFADPEGVRYDLVAQAAYPRATLHPFRMSVAR